MLEGNQVLLNPSGTGRVTSRKISTYVSERVFCCVSWPESLSEQ